MPRNLIIGDIHGMYDRMLSALSAAGFRPEEDILYSVGDFCDRGPDPVKVLDYLMALPRFYPVAGNHDMWLYEYLCGRGPASIWLDPRNGGSATYNEFKLLHQSKKTAIRDWYGSVPFIRTTGKYIILHAGPSESVSTGTELSTRMEGMTLSRAYKIRRLLGSYAQLVFQTAWDRDYIYSAMNANSFSDNLRQPIDTDRTIICGHTPLKEVFHSEKYHLTCIDTGSFVKEGHITVMDLDSNTLYSSN